MSSLALLMETELFLSLLWGHTFQAPQEDAFALASYKEKRGQSWLQFSQARGRNWDKFPHYPLQNPHEVTNSQCPLQRGTTLGGQRVASPGQPLLVTQEEPTLTCPCSGEHGQGVIYKSQCVFHRSVSNQEVPGAGSAVHVLRDIFTTRGLLPNL